MRPCDSVFDSLKANYEWLWNKTELKPQENWGCTNRFFTLGPWSFWLLGPSSFSPLHGDIFLMRRGHHKRTLFSDRCKHNITFALSNPVISHHLHASFSFLFLIIGDQTWFWGNPPSPNLTGQIYERLTFPTCNVSFLGIVWLQIQIFLLLVFLLLCFWKFGFYFWKVAMSCKHWKSGK